MNRKAIREGKKAGVEFVIDGANSWQALKQALAPGQEGADASLINAIGREATAELFGLKRADYASFQKACADYNNAFVRVVAGAVARGEGRRAVMQTAIAFAKGGQL